MNLVKYFCILLLVILFLFLVPVFFPYILIEIMVVIAVIETIIFYFLFRKNANSKKLILSVFGVNLISFMPIQIILTTVFYSSYKILGTLTFLFAPLLTEIFAIVLEFILMWWIFTKVDKNILKEIITKKRLIKLVAIANVASVLIVITLFILTIATPVPLTPTTPVGDAGRLISSLRNPWYSVMGSESVTFDLGESINRDALSEKSAGIQPEQICLSAGAFQDSDIWEEGSEQSSVRYSGTTKTDVRFKGVCGRAQRLADADYLFEEGEFEFSWFSDCRCLDKPEQECCLLAVVKK